MSKEEMKIAISEMLENTSEPVLNEVFDYLKATEEKSTELVALSQNLRTILSEDSELLARLAQ